MAKAIARPMASIREAYTWPSAGIHHAEVPASAEEEGRVAALAGIIRGR